MKRKLNKVMLNKIEILAKDRHTIKEISDMLQVSMSSVFTATEEMRRMGIIPMVFAGDDIEHQPTKEKPLNKPKKTEEVTLTSFQSEAKILFEEGLYYREIAEKLNSTVGSICNCRKVLKRKNAIDEKKRSINIKKRRKELQISIKEKYDSGKTIEEIASEFGIKPQKVSNIIDRIKVQNVERKNNDFEVIKQRDRIKELLEEGATYKEIAQELGFTTTKVGNIIYKMREKKLLDEEKIKESRSQRRNPMQSEIKRLLEEGATYEEIANIMGKNKTCITDAVHKLRQEGMLDETKIQNRRKELRISLEKYREQIIELLNKGYTYNEIKEKLEISDYNIKQYIHSLYKRGLLNSKEIEESRKKRRLGFTKLQIEVKKLLDEGYSIKDIARKTNKSENSLYGVVCRIRKKEAKKREIIKHIIGMSRSCISKGKYDEAIMLLEEIDFEDFEKEKKEKLNKLKEYIAKSKLKKEHDIEMQR